MRCGGHIEDSFEGGEERGYWTMGQKRGREARGNVEWKSERIALRDSG
jgi:hypothetical protein